MKIYNSQTAPNPRRVRIFLAEKGIQVPYEEVDINNAVNRTPEFRKKNPMGTLPVLELDDGTCIAESVAICRYFEELQPNPPLMGVDGRDLSRSRRRCFRILPGEHGSEVLRPILMLQCCRNRGPCIAGCAATHRIDHEQRGARQVRILDGGFGADRRSDRARRDERQLRPACDRRLRIEGHGEREARAGLVDPDASAAAAALRLVLGERDRAVRGSGGKQPLRGRCLPRMVVLAPEAPTQVRQDDVRCELHGV